MIQGLWYFQVDTIIDEKIGDADATCTSTNQRQRSWPGGKRSINTSTVSTVTTNRNIFRRFLFQWVEC